MTSNDEALQLRSEALANAPCAAGAEAIVAFGTNVAFEGVSGAALLARASEALGQLGLIAVRRSSFWLSPAWPDDSDPAFVNACAAFDAESWSPIALMAALHKVEAAFGRVRSRRNAPRTLDLDLVALDDLVLEGPKGLILPHPRMAQRAFVLLPLQEIAPAWRHPGTGEGVGALLTAAAGRAAMQRIGPWEAGSV